MFYSKRLRKWCKGRGKPEYKQPAIRKVPTSALIGAYGKVVIHGRCGQAWPIAFAKCPTCYPTPGGA